MNISVQRLYSDVVLPEYKHEDDSGMDIRAYFSEEFKSRKDFPDGCSYDDKLDAFLIEANCRAIIPTGIKVGIVDKSLEIQVRPRSGMSFKSGLTVLNTPGTIDAGYTGEIGVIVYNSNQDSVCSVQHGDRIAQLVLCPVLKIEWNVVKELDETIRGVGGFGHTGVK